MKRWMILIVLIGIVMLATAAAAQDDALQGGYVISAEQGTLEDNGDGTYTLELTGVPETTRWVIIAPAINTGRIGLPALIEYWNGVAVEANTRPAVLEVDGSAAYLTLSEPEYSDGELIFTAVVGDVYEGSELARADILSAFSESGLFITTDQAFEDALFASYEATGTTTRAQSDCPSKSRDGKC